MWTDHTNAALIHTTVVILSETFTQPNIYMVAELN